MSDNDEPVDETVEESSADPSSDDAAPAPAAAADDDSTTGDAAPATPASPPAAQRRVGAWVGAAALAVALALGGFGLGRATADDDGHHRARFEPRSWSDRGDDRDDRGGWDGPRHHGGWGPDSDGFRERREAQS